MVKSICTHKRGKLMAKLTKSYVIINNTIIVLNLNTFSFSEKSQVHIGLPKQSVMVDWESMTRDHCKYLHASDPMW